MQRFTLLPLAALVVLAAACTDTAQIMQPDAPELPQFTIVIPSTTASTSINFNGIGSVQDPAPDITAGGVTVSFSGLEVSEIGATVNGFGGGQGSNQVIVVDRTVFNGQFLTALGFRTAQFRTSGFVRTIFFDRGVTDVSMYVADIDAGERITATAFDAAGVSLLILPFVAGPRLDSELQLVDFGSVTGIRKVTLVGNDPIGIDHLSFSGGDGTPPEITFTVDGDLGDNEWYTSDIDISWTVTEDESTVTIVGCIDVTVTSDTSGDTFNCEAKSDGGEAEASVTVKRDATDPTVTYSGNVGPYDVADEVAITCSSDDITSGVNSDTCGEVSGAAYTFGLGTSTFSASATDNAGNIGNGSTSFDVTASFDGLCALVQSFVSHAGVANSMCAEIGAAARSDAGGRTNARDGSLSAFINEVGAQTGKRVDADDAAVLIAIATALMN